MHAIKYLFIISLVIIMIARTVRCSKYLSNFFDVSGSYPSVDLQSDIPARSIDKSTSFSQFLKL